MPLDATDRQLLSLLQRNAHITAQELGEVLHLSASQAGRRRQQLEAAGYFNSIRAVLVAGRLGLNVQAFIQVQMAAHASEAAQGFARLVHELDQVTDVWILTGEADYLLRVYCTDLAALNRLIQDVLLPHPAVARVQSQIVMDQLKRDAPLPT